MESGGLMKAKLTKRLLDQTETANPSGLRIFDTETPGFLVTIYPSGRKTFAVKYGPKEAGRFLVIGPYGRLTVDQARTKAKELLAEATLGNDPAAAEATTFEAWSAVYLSRYASKRKRFPRQVSLYLARAVESFGAMPLERITPDTIETFLAQFKDKPATMNRTLQALRPCFQAAVLAGRSPRNPCRAVARSKRENPPRARVLSSEEMAGLLAALQDEDAHTRAAFQILIETGARLSEVLQARWEDFDLETATWRIPSPKAGRPQVIPVPSTVAKMLRALPRLSPFVIPGQKAKPGQAPIPRFDLKGPWRRLTQKAGIANVRVHDLRRTFGLAVARQAGLHVAQQLLRHADVRVTAAVYSPLGIDDLRAALEKRAEVLPFPEKKKRNG